MGLLLLTDKYRFENEARQVVTKNTVAVATQQPSSRFYLGRSVSYDVNSLTLIFRSNGHLHFESKLNKDLMGSLVKDRVKMVGLDTGDRKITNLMIIKLSVVASVVIHICSSF